MLLGIHIYDGHVLMLGTVRFWWMQDYSNPDDNSDGNTKDCEC